MDTYLDSASEPWLRVDIDIETAKEVTAAVKASRIAGHGSKIRVPLAEKADRLLELAQVSTSL